MKWCSLVKYYKTYFSIFIFAVQFSDDIFHECWLRLSALLIRILFWNIYFTYIHFNVSRNHQSKYFTSDIQTDFFPLILYGYTLYTIQYTFIYFCYRCFFLFVNFSRWRQFECCRKCVLLAQNIIFVIPIHFAIKQTNAAVRECRNINIIFLLGFALFRCYYYLLDILKFILFCTQRWLSNNHFSIMQYFSEFLLKKSV